MALLPETPVAETGGSVTQCIESVAVRLSLSGSHVLRIVFCRLCLESLEVAIEPPTLLCRDLS